MGIVRDTGRFLLRLAIIAFILGFIVGLVLGFRMGAVAHVALSVDAAWAVLRV